MLVSIAMITYNHEEYLKDALEGILMQETNFNFEIVVGEDASKDATRSILKAYEAKYPDKFKITYHNENVGMMNNFIHTLKACNGKYIALCEGDDYWVEPKKLQKQVSFLESNNKFVGCFHNVWLKDERFPERKMKSWRTFERDVFELEDTFSKTSLFHTCSYVFRRSALDIPSWFKEVKSGDMALFSITAAKGKLKLISGNMSVYRKNENGVTSNQNIINYHKNRMQLMRYFIGYFSKEYKKKIKSIFQYHKNEIWNVRVNSIKKKLNPFLV